MRHISALGLFCFTFCFTGIKAQESFLVDNCDDGNAQAICGGWWYTYNDSANGGNSVVSPVPGRFSMEKPGFNNRGQAAHLKGIAGDKLGWDFVGMGVTLSQMSSCPASQPVNLKGYTNIKFKMKGKVSGGRLIIMLPYTKNQCEQGSDFQATLTEWADYEAALTSKLKPDWVEITLNLRKDFHQPKWAKKNAIVPVEKVLENSKNFNFQYSSPDGDSIDLWIDDLMFTK